MISLELNRQLPDIGTGDDLYAEALGFAGMPFLGST
jgi:hypothetical protein